MKVAFQGEHGAYSELAAIRYFGNSIGTVPCKNFSDIFSSVENRKADLGIVPLENSLEGSVGQNYDLLSKTNLKISGETVLRVVHCLIGMPDAELKDIKRVYSHPQALGQCRAFLERIHSEQIPEYDTAGSVKIVKKAGSKASAGIASELAAKIYGMKILKKGIESNRSNFTRFVIVSRSESPRTGNDKTSLILMLKHEPGSLYRALRTFANKNINLTKLESRPIPGRPWEYSFYVDLEGHFADEKIRDALDELKEHTSSMKIFGSYPRAGYGAPPKHELKTPEGIAIKRVAIIGAYGNMGKWLCRFFLDEGIKVFASGRNKEKLARLGKEIPVEIKKSTADAVKDADMVIVSVLMKDLENVIKEVAQNASPKQVILDITSAKQEPVSIMHKHVKGATILGTHPLFGPGAVDNNQNFILTPTNAKEKKFAETFGKWLGDRGFRVFTVSPSKHDEIMSVALCLSHFIGMSAGETWVSNGRISELREMAPTSFKRLLGLVENIAVSDPAFYANLQSILPGVQEVEASFIKHAESLLKVVKNKDENGFAKHITDLRKALEKS